MSDKNKTKKSGKGPGGESGERSLQKIQAFFNSVGVEFRKITWPDSNELVESTVVVLVLIAILATVVLVFDKAIQFALLRF
ncbi:MAG: preprotein translocase subunit SecE [Kiritimatiellia bacterium]